MSLLCLFGSHRPSLASVTKRREGLGGICESCARPLVKGADGKWRAADPVYAAQVATATE